MIRIRLTGPQGEVRLSWTEADYTSHMNAVVEKCAEAYSKMAEANSKEQDIDLRSAENVVRDGK